MPYRALDEQSVPDYLQGVPALGAFCAPGALAVTEVGDGNLNQVFIVTGAAGERVVLKQALPYLRVAGESWPLTRGRMRFETLALRFYASVVPELVPQVLHDDEALSLVVLEYLTGLEVMRGPIVRRQQVAGFAEKVGRFMAHTHFYTSDAYLSGPEKKARVAAFSNPELCALQEAFVFTNPLMDAPENRWNPFLELEVTALRRHATLKRAVAAAKTIYMTSAQALLHGDLHTGSLMVSPTELRVIDPEFAFFGPQGYDVGTLFANLVLGAASHAAHTPDPDERREYQRYLLDLIPATWAVYAHTFSALWQEHNTGDLAPPAYWAFAGGDEAFATFRYNYLAGVLQDAARFGGCELLRRLLGIVSVAELTQISDDAARAVVERGVIQVARDWLLGNVSDADTLAGVAKRVLKVPVLDVPEEAV